MIILIKNQLKIQMMMMMMILCHKKKQQRKNQKLQLVGLKLKLLKSQRKRRAEKVIHLRIRKGLQEKDLHRKKLIKKQIIGINLLSQR